MSSGKIVAVNISAHWNIPKYPVDGPVMLGSHGLVGDYHNREMRQSFSKPGTFKPNTDRHLTLFADEVMFDLNCELGTELRAGSLGENITTRGLGDLSQIRDGMRLRIGNHVIIWVTEQNQPCKNLAPLHRLLVKKVYGRRGLLCAIQCGRGHRIQEGDPIEVLSDL